MIYLGIDTSNYTTSAAAVTESGFVSKRRLLPVKEGERGLRQSDGVFHHMKILPELFNELAGEIDLKDAAAIGVSVKPRNVEGSYMPVFLAGHGYARVIADALKIPVFEFSHQDGHIMAGIFSGGCFELLENEFLSVHLSGGTTEILRTRYTGTGFENVIIGGTRDISAGQLIDRVGVALGMRFPAGREMEQTAKNAVSAVKLPVSTDGAYMNFSGTETKAASLIKDGNAAEIALGTLIAVKNTLVKTLNSAIEKTGVQKVLVVGGVASNALIRNGLTDEVNGNVYFASAELSSDNAVGIASLAKFCKEN